MTYASDVTGVPARAEAEVVGKIATLLLTSTSKFYGSNPQDGGSCELRFHVADVCAVTRAGLCCVSKTYRNCYFTIFETDTLPFVGSFSSISIVRFFHNVEVALHIRSVKQLCYPLRVKSQH